MLSGTIFDLKRFSIHDGPGIRTTVFLKGCPLRCLWCHNPESQEREPELMVRENLCILCDMCLAGCPQGAIRRSDQGLVTDPMLCTVCGTCFELCAAEARQIAGYERNEAEVMAALIRDRSFYDQSGGGVTFSGGEPFWQPDFLLQLLRRCRAEELHTAVDTSGAVSWAALDTARPLVDLFLYDLKAMDDGRHRALTGVSNHRILENLKRLSAAGAAIELRMALVPSLNDDDENLRQTAAFIASLPQRHTIALLPYHRAAAGKYARLQRSYPLAGLQGPSRAQMEAAAAFFAGKGLEVRIGG